MYICMYVCMYVGMYVCMYIYIYIYVYVYTYMCVYTYFRECRRQKQNTTGACPSCQLRFPHCFQESQPTNKYNI